MGFSREMVIALLGTLRLALFDKNAVNWFPASNEAALRSFWVPSLAAPGVVYLMILNMPPHFAEVPQQILFTVLGLGMIIWFCGYYLAAFYICRSSGRLELYPRYVTVNNWATLIFLVFLIPALMISSASVPFGNSGNYIHQFANTMVIIYSWFIARHALNLRPFAAVGMVILSSLIELLVLFGTSLILIQAAGGPAQVQLMMEAMQQTGMDQGIAGGASYSEEIAGE